MSAGFEIDKFIYYKVVIIVRMDLRVSWNISSGPRSILNSFTLLLCSVWRNAVVEAHDVNILCTLVKDCTINGLERSFSTLADHVFAVLRITSHRRISFSAQRRHLFVLPKATLKLTRCCVSQLFSRVFSQFWWICLIRSCTDNLQLVRWRRLVQTMHTYWGLTHAKVSLFFCLQTKSFSFSLAGCSP